MKFNSIYRTAQQYLVILLNCSLFSMFTVLILFHDMIENQWLFNLYEVKTPLLWFNLKNQVHQPFTLFLYYSLKPHPYQTVYFTNNIQFNCIFIFHFYHCSGSFGSIHNSLSNSWNWKSSNRKPNALNFIVSATEYNIVVGEFNQI